MKELFLLLFFSISFRNFLIFLSLKIIGKCSSIARRLQSRLSPVVSLSVPVTAALDVVVVVVVVYRHTQVICCLANFMRAVL